MIGAFNLASFLYRGKDWGSVRSAKMFGKMERVETTTFCEMGLCPALASWRIGYGLMSVELCSVHTIRTMRNRRLWTIPP